MSMRLALSSLVVAACVGSASADVVYATGNATGFDTPFNASTPAGTKYGDSGYLGFGPVQGGIDSLILGLATYSSAPAAAGTTDIKFTFNDGDPSGFVFGSGATLYSTTITNVQLPATDGTGPSYFYLIVPLPNITLPGVGSTFNNFGWSIGVENYSFAGDFGWQNHGNYNNLGYYTNNASHYNPGTNSWNLFAYGPNDPGDIANFVATLTATVPEPASMAALLVPMMLVRRVRRAR